MREDKIMRVIEQDWTNQQISSKRVSSNRLYGYSNVQLRTATAAHEWNEWEAWLCPWLSLPPCVFLQPTVRKSGSQEAASSWIHLLPHRKSVRACFTLCLPVAPSGNKAVKLMAAQINGWSIKLTRPHRSIRFFLAGADAEAWDQPQRCQDPAASRRDI